MINFISNLPRDLRTGGFSAMNAAALTALTGCGDVNYVGPIDPPTVFQEKAASKLLRSVGTAGNFAFFSRRRLGSIAREVDARCSASADLDFFHGFTPWLAVLPRRPYVAWSDCTFRDYIDVFHPREKFRAGDLARIETGEARWLANADRVFFTSEWAAKRGIANYSLDREKVAVVGIFGEMEMPERDVYEGGKEFAFISTNFDAKGGPIVLAAFREVRKRHPDARLTVVGAAPRKGEIEEGVSFTGFLRKEVRAEYDEFRRILGRARAVIHPTKSDITPLLVVEAGYFGCPTISSRRFAIPELIDDGISGVLLNDPSQLESVADAMVRMLTSDDQYRRMRTAAWTKTRSLHTRQRFEANLLSNVRMVLAAVQPSS